MDYITYKQFEAMNAVLADIDKRLNILEEKIGIKKNEKAK